MEKEIVTRKGIGEIMFAIGVNLTVFYVLFHFGKIDIFIFLGGVVAIFIYIRIFFIIIENVLHLYQFEASSFSVSKEVDKVKNKLIFATITYAIGYTLLGLFFYLVIDPFYVWIVEFGLLLMVICQLIMIRLVGEIVTMHLQKEK